MEIHTHLGDTTSKEEEELLLQAIRRINGKVLGLVIGLVMGLILFVATLWLVVKASGTGAPVGPHMSLLNQFFPGYSVTVFGSFVGLFYGILTGYLFGWFIGWIYNTIIGLKHRRK